MFPNFQPEIGQPRFANICISIVFNTGFWMDAGLHALNNYKASQQ